MLLVGGWSFSVYAIQLVFRNLKPILQEHWHLAFGTVCVCGVWCVVCVVWCVVCGVWCVVCVCVFLLTKDQCMRGVQQLFKS